MAISCTSAASGTAEPASGTLDVAIVALDATRYTEKARQHNVHGYPTVKLYTRRNKEGQLYDASREPAEMLKFLKKSIGDHP
jgi:hypothetical protein